MKAMVKQMTYADYKVTVPLVRYDEEDLAYLAREFRKADVKRVFLAPPLLLKPTAERPEVLKKVKNGIDFFRGEGLEVGVWINSFGHGGPLSHDVGVEHYDFTVIHGITGQKEEASFCPADPAFQQAYCDWVADLAACGGDIFLIDDDYRLSQRPSGTGCCCPRHMQMLTDKLGYAVKREDLYKQVFAGKPTPVRKAWLDVMGATLEDFAKLVRQTVDRVNPAMRLAFCAVHSTWGTDGTDALRLTRIFAGNTKPLLRLIGAPYWANGSGYWQLPQSIEIERMQAAWCRGGFEGAGDDIELLSEGDAYPRPRFQTPASYLEGFDFCLRADGTTDGILKYMCDYTSTARYEKGYLSRHCKHIPLYQQVSDYFDDLRPAGIRAYEYPDRTGMVNYPEQGEEIWRVPDSLCPMGAKLFAPLGIPTIYSGKGIFGGVFGENGDVVPLEDLDSCLILDGTAARKLRDRGFDVGFESLQDRENPPTEYFIGEKETLPVTNSSRACYAVKGLSPKAKVTSVWTDGTPASYTYENDRGCKLLVFLFAADRSEHRSSLFCAYCRRNLIAETAKNFFRRPLPYTLTDAPLVYTLCKTDESGNTLSVCLFNAFPDETDELTITLADDFDEVRCMQGGAVLQGRKLILNEGLAPYGFTAVRLNKKR